MTDLYSILELERSASESEIKKAYRKLALIHHPDRGGDAEKFKELNRAYAILSDPEKRDKYDRFGIDNENDMTNDFNPFDIFRQFTGMNDFNNIFPGGDNNRKKQIDPIVHQIKVNLQELYNGIEKNIEYDRKIGCESCNETGCKDKCNRQCNSCNGKGVKLHTIKINPMMVQQMTRECDKCNGTGSEEIKEMDKCNKCDGKKYTIKKDSIKFKSEPGSNNGTYVHKGKGNKLNGQRSDLIVKLTYDNENNEYSTFKINDANLIYELSLTLGDAFFGCTKVINHPSGKKLLIETCELIKDNSIKIINDYGMPILNRGKTKYGDLIIKFVYDYPDSNYIKKTANMPGTKMKYILTSYIKQDIIDFTNCVKVKLVDFEENNDFDNDDDDNDEARNIPGCAQQ
jgi:DnaJ family protein A protein 2